jgi:hypothetical protein
MLRNESPVNFYYNDAKFGDAHNQSGARRRRPKPTRPTGQDMRAAFGTELPRHGAIEIAARKLFRRPFGVTEDLRAAYS